MRRSLLLLLVLAFAAVSGLAFQEESSGAKSDDGLGEVTDSIQKEVVALRGLPFRNAVDRRWKDREAVVDEFTVESGFHGDGESGGEEAELSASTRTLAFLGLVEPDRDIEEVAGEFMADSVSGYYDPDTKQFTIVRGADGVLNRMTIFHELVHAIEDQHYDLMKRERGYRANSQQDHVQAWRAVIEGSATYYTDLYLDSHPGMKSEIVQAITGIRPPGTPDGKDGKKPAATETTDNDETETTDPREEALKTADRFNAMPAYLVITKSMFPYFNGAEFLRHVLPRLEVPEGGDALGMLYANPPLSTEQILHPEKYLGARDLPATVALPDLSKVLGEGWEQTDENTMGELGMGIAVNRWRFLKQTLFQVMAVIKPPPGGFFQNPDELMNTPLIFRGPTGKAVGGWDGDRYAVYAKGDRTCFAWVSCWDSEEDAREFHALYSGLMAKKYAGHGKAEDGVLTGTAGGRSLLAVHGDLVVIVEAAPAETLSAAAALLRTATVTRDPADAVPQQK